MPRGGLPPAGAAPGCAPALLVIDDEGAVRQGLMRLVACAAVPWREVAAAGNGEQALSLARRLLPEVVVLDVDLAGEDGLGLLPRLPGGASVLVLTSHGDGRTRERAHQLGACAFVEKQWPASVLLAALNSLVAALPCRTHGGLRGDKTPAPQGASSPPVMAASSAAPAPLRP